MADLGRLPKGERFGMVPAWPLQLSDVAHGPKALYASLCTSADEKGHCWRSIGRLAEEFDQCRRQIQRWLNVLEASGLLVRMGRKGRAPFLLVVRDPEGRNWARSLNLKNVVTRRIPAARYGREGARRKKEIATLASQQNDADVSEIATSASPKHDLSNKVPLTEEAARQERVVGASGAENRRAYGLKRLLHNPSAELIQEQLNQLVFEVGGWDVFAALPPERMIELLSARCAPGTAAPEIEAALGL